MEYQKLQLAEFFEQITTEPEARQWLWRCRFQGQDFVCPDCGDSYYWQHHTRPEVRECSSCQRQVRLRAGTILRDSKLPVLTWLRAIAWMMQGKRGISALELQRHLHLGCYRSAWLMLHKIRHALSQRDERYQLQGIVELDGARFGRQHAATERTVLVAVETKDWVDERGRPKSRAGFAKTLLVTQESRAQAQPFIDQAIRPASMVNTDGARGLRQLERVDVDYQFVGHSKVMLERWLPWVHRFISNAKAWLVGTHHGVRPQHLRRYLAEFTYRFNRRHDPAGLFHRAAFACSLVKPPTLQVLRT